MKKSMEQENIAPSIQKNNFMREKRKNLFFYISLMIIPVAQFLIFYIGVNIRSFAYAFQKIDVAANTVQWSLDNFRNIFERFKTSTLYSELISVSLKAYLYSLLVGVPLGLFFSYYISEKLPASAAFRVLLFVPSIISAVTMVTIYLNFVESALPDILGDLFGITHDGFLENINTRLPSIIFYSLFIGFGTAVLMYSNSMSSIPPEIIEAGKLDGAIGMKKFVYIVLPQIFGTLSTFLIIGVAGIFTNQLNLFSFYDAGAPDGVKTFGYYLYSNAQQAVNEAEYPYLAALGLLLTAIAVPLTMLIKWALEKFGFSED